MQNQQIQIYNADCVEVMEKIPASTIDCIVSDPPYGVNFKGASYLDDTQAVLNNMHLWYKHWFRILKPNSFVFLFVGVKTLHNWIQAGIDAGFTYKNIIATRSFNNGSPTAKSNFGFQFQPIILFSKGNGRKLNKVDFIPTSKEWLKDKRNKNPKPFTYEYPNFIKTEWAFATAKRASKNYHPNEKNINLLKFFIEVSTKEKDTVFDGFLGSGSTALACLRCNRKFIGCELTREYFEVAQNRIGLFGVNNG